MDQFLSTFDFQRILIGDEPPLFFLEIIFRTMIIYGYSLALIRWLGSRAIGQLSVVEFLLVIALGSAVGDAMFYPDVPCPSSDDLAQFGALNRGALASSVG